MCELRFRAFLHGSSISAQGCVEAALVPRKLPLAKFTLFSITLLLRLVSISKIVNQDFKFKDPKGGQTNRLALQTSRHSDCKRKSSPALDFFQQAQGLSQIGMQERSLPGSWRPSAT